MVRTSDHVGQMLGSVRDCRQSLFGPSADRVHDHVEYSLTEVGESLRPIIEAMKTWGNHYRDEHESWFFQSLEVSGAAEPYCRLGNEKGRNLSAPAFHHGASGGS